MEITEKYRFYCIVFHFYFEIGDDIDKCINKKCPNIYDYKIENFMFNQELKE